MVTDDVYLTRQALGHSSHHLSQLAGHQPQRVALHEIAGCFVFCQRIVERSLLGVQAEFFYRSKLSRGDLSRGSLSGHHEPC